MNHVPNVLPQNPFAFQPSRTISPALQLTELLVFTAAPPSPALTHEGLVMVPIPIGPGPRPCPHPMELGALGTAMGCCCGAELWCRSCGTHWT